MLSAESETTTPEKDAGGDEVPEKPPQAVTPPAEEFVSAGEGTMSDGKGSTKKVFFLQKKDGEQPRWLKKMSDGLSSVGAAANTTMHNMGAAAGDTMSRLVKSTEKSEETKEAQKMEAEDKPEGEAVEDNGATKDRLKGIVDAGRSGLDAASTRISGLMSSMKTAKHVDGDEGAEAPPAESMSSRLAALRIAMAHMGKSDKPSPDEEIAALKAQVAELKDTVAALVDKVAALEGKAQS